MSIFRKNSKKKNITEGDPNNEEAQKKEEVLRNMIRKTGCAGAYINFRTSRLLDEAVPMYMDDL